MKILGLDYRLVEEGSHEMIGAFGRHHADRQIIQIAENLAPQQRVMTVLHEILEAVDYCLGLELRHNAKMALEAALYQVLTANGVNLSPLVADLGKVE